MSLIIAECNHSKLFGNFLGEYLRWRRFLVHLSTNNMEPRLKKRLLNQSITSVIIIIIISVYFTLTFNNFSKMQSPLTSTNLRLEISNMFKSTIFKTLSNNWLCTLDHAILRPALFLIITLDYCIWLLHLPVFCFSYKVMRLFPSTREKMMQVYGMEKMLNITVKSFIPKDVSVF